jgi:hypothetical protein
MSARDADRWRTTDGEVRRISLDASRGLANVLRDTPGTDEGQHKTCMVLAQCQHEPGLRTAPRGSERNRTHHRGNPNRTHWVTWRKPNRFQRRPKTGLFNTPKNGMLRACSEHCWQDSPTPIRRLSGGQVFMQFDCTGRAPEAQRKARRNRSCLQVVR